MKTNVSSFFRTAFLLLFFPFLLALSGCDKDDDLNIFTDVRDGQEYLIVTIGSQTWMAENLNYDPGAGDSWCFDDDAGNCPNFGRLYDWTTALTVAPDGWHLPTDAEWNTLINFLGGETVAGGHMKEAGLTHWEAPNEGADNSSGFTGLPVGIRFHTGLFSLDGTGTAFWSSTEKEIDRSWAIFLDKDIADTFRTGTVKIAGLSVRCIMD